MAIRIITAADLDTFLAVIQEARPALADRLEAARIFDADVIIGDPTVPILITLDREKIDSGTLSYFPPVLAAAIRTKNGNAIQVTNFYPLPIREPGGAAKVAAALKLLASVLREGGRRFPIVRQWPVFAQFAPELVNFMKNGVPAASIPAPFPNAFVDPAFPRLIAHLIYADAENAVSSLAVDVS